MTVDVIVNLWNIIEKHEEAIVVKKTRDNTDKFVGIVIMKVSLRGGAFLLWGGPRWITYQEHNAVLLALIQFEQSISLQME